LGGPQPESARLEASSPLMKQRCDRFMAGCFSATEIDANDHAFLTMGSVGTSQDHHVQVKRAQTMSYCGEK
jgi:hypothetical protein